MKAYLRLSLVYLAIGGGLFLTYQLLSGNSTVPQALPPVPPGQPAVVDPLPPEPRGGASLSNFDPQRLLNEIATTKDPQVLALVDAIYNAPTLEEKGTAADALASLGGYEAVANLLRVAGLHEDTDAREAILSGLNALSDPLGFETLASTLAATRDPQFLDAVMVQLPRTGSASVLETLVELYRERTESPFQKNQVLLAIAALRHPDLARPLGKICQHAPEEALIAAATKAHSAATAAAAIQNP